MKQHERDDLLIAIRSDQIEMKSDMRHLIADNKDKEDRIRSLEKKWWTTVGAFVITLLTTILTALL